MGSGSYSSFGFLLAVISIAGSGLMFIDLVDVDGVALSCVSVSGFGVEVRGLWIVWSGISITSPSSILISSSLDNIAVILSFSNALSDAVLSVFVSVVLEIVLSEWFLAGALFITLAVSLLIFSLLVLACGVNSDKMDLLLIICTDGCSVRFLLRIVGSKSGGGISKAFLLCTSLLALFLISSSR